MIPSNLTGGTGLMNPSVIIDKGRIIVNLRHVNYTLCHCEGEQLFQNRYGPLVYLNPENDIKLKTTNYLCILNDDLSVKEYFKIDTSLLDVDPLWDFHGLEDARLVSWGDKLYATGVRRDTTTNGEGRMELSKIVKSNKGVKEIARTRIEPPNNAKSYCEKNWMPVLDMPYHYVKWTNPTEVIKVNIKDGSSETVFLSNSIIPGLPDFRGGSQVINWKDFRLCVVHQVNLFNNSLGQKDAGYMHRFVVWDKNWKIVKVSDPFSFMTGEIEFCCGAAIYNDDLLISFGFQDNAAYLMKIPGNSIESIIDGE